MSAENPIVTPDLWTTKTQATKAAQELAAEVERASRSVCEALSHLASSEERLVSLRARLTQAAEADRIAGAAWLENERLVTEARTARHAAVAAGEAP